MGIRARAALVIVGVFLAGAVVGSAVTVRVVARRVSAIFEGDPKQTLARLYGAELDRRLHLTRDQRGAVERIVNDDHGTLARLGQSSYPELSELRRKRHARIRELLTPQQRAAFDVLAEENEKRRREEVDLPP